MRSTIALIPLALAALVGFWPELALARDSAVVREFKRTHACPSTGKMDPEASCPGYVVDHKDPLCDGGADAVENMQYEETRASYIKDILERKLCALKKQLQQCQHPTP